MSSVFFFFLRMHKKFLLFLLFIYTLLTQASAEMQSFSEQLPNAHKFSTWNHYQSYICLIQDCIIEARLQKMCHCPYTYRPECMMLYMNVAVKDKTMYKSACFVWDCFEFDHLEIRWCLFGVAGEEHQMSFCVFPVKSSCWQSIDPLTRILLGAYTCWTCWPWVKKLLTFVGLVSDFLRFLRFASFLKKLPCRLQLHNIKFAD